MLALTFALRGRARWHAPANTVVTCMALALLILPAWRIAGFEWQHGAARNAWDPDRAMADMPALAGKGVAAERPDIYHFVFDRYGSEDTLTRHFGITEPIGPYLESAASTSRATPSRTTSAPRPRSPPPSTWTISTTSSRTRA